MYRRYIWVTNGECLRHAADHTPLPTVLPRSSDLRHRLVDERTPEQVEYRSTRVEGRALSLPRIPSDRTCGKQMGLLDGVVTDIEGYCRA